MSDSKPSKVFVVFGACGEYSDHREWFVAVYFSEQKAKAHVLNATTRANELCSIHGYLALPDGANEHDPNMQADYDGARYSYAAVPLMG